MTWIAVAEWDWYVCVCRKKRLSIPIYAYKRHPFNFEWIIHKIDKQKFIHRWFCAAFITDLSFQIVRITPMLTNPFTPPNQLFYLREISFEQMHESLVSINLLKYPLRLFVMRASWLSKHQIASMCARTWCAFVYSFIPIRSLACSSHTVTVWQFWVSIKRGKTFHWIFLESAQ